MAPLSLTEAWQQPASALYASAEPGRLHRGAASGRHTNPERTAGAPILVYRGYPEPWLNGSEVFRQLWQRNYIDSYLMRDIGALFPSLNRDRFRQFVALLSQHSGNLLNNADIARSWA